tara:strand:- start:585 stop:1277 length:693 start_codon:yes stop_codon:yes gene_type:complete
MIKSNLEEYIKHSHGKVMSERREFTIFDNINVNINEELPETVDIEMVLKTISSLIPMHLTYNLESIEIGHIKEFDEKNINALYRDRTMYITNKQDNDEDIIDDIIHEIAHSVEQLFLRELYKDKKIENEFLGKRNRLYSLLKAAGHRVEESDFLNPHYSENFDEFLYKELGYEFLGNMTSGLFASAYAATSIREYFAIGFEEYYIGDRDYLKKLSPNLYNKMMYLDGLKF